MTEDVGDLMTLRCRTGHVIQDERSVSRHVGNPKRSARCGWVIIMIEPAYIFKYLVTCCGVELIGLNVTIPYKQAVLPFIDTFDESAAEIGAVNCIDMRNGQMKGYNTDAYGFEKSVLGLLNTPNLETLLNLNLKALVLGTGGASKAIAYVLKKWHIPFHYVSRTRSETSLSYEDIDEKIMTTHRLIVNTTPLGMSPNTEGCPPLPYKYIGNQHFLYDLVYNPAITQFLKRGLDNGANGKNGLDMLYFQAERGWEIWNQ